VGNVQITRETKKNDEISNYEPTNFVE